MALGNLYLLAEAVSYLVPEFVVAVSVALAIGSVAGFGVIMSASSRFTRR